MKLHSHILFAALAAFVAVACSKQETESFEDVSNLVVVKYNVTASSLTKTSLNGKTVSWTDGDKVNVFDDKGTSTTGTIASGVLTTAIAADATKIYVSYPYSAAATLSGSAISTRLPEIQRATAGSFDENANLSVAWGAKDASTLHFLNAGTIVKFSLATENVSEVTVVSAGGEAIAGAATLSMSGESSEAGSVSAVPASGAQSYVTLKPANGGHFSSATTYVVAVLPQTLASGVSIVANNTSNQATYATVTDALTLKVNTPVSFGNLNISSFSNDLYTQYNAGMPIIVAGQVYRKAVNGAAGLISITKKENILWYFLNRTTGILFFDDPSDNHFYWATNTMTATEKNGNNDDFVCISRYSDNPVTIGITDNSGNGTALYSKLVTGSLKFKNVNLDLSPSSGGYIFNNNGATSHYDALHFDGCTIKTGKPSIYYRSATGYGIKSIKFIGCTFLCTQMPGNLSLINCSGTTSFAGFEEVVFENNVVCSSSPQSKFQTIVNLTGSGAATPISVTIRDNIFYNVFYNTGSSVPQFRFSQEVSPLVFENNIMYSALEPGVAQSYVELGNASQSTDDLHIGDNYLYVASGTPVNWKWTNKTAVVEKQSETPFDSFTFDSSYNPTYSIKSAYLQYGPKQ